jgi:hypothetical protein
MTNREYAAVVAAVLRTARLRASSEAALQESIRDTLTAAKLEFEREKPLGPKDRPDFLLAAGAVPIEAKARYPKKAIYRQLCRYAEHQGVDAIILVTGTAMGMPAEINGKPIHVVSIGMGMLGC